MTQDKPNKPLYYMGVKLSSEKPEVKLFEKPRANLAEVTIVTKTDVTCKHCGSKNVVQMLPPLAM